MTARAWATACWIALTMFVLTEVFGAITCASQMVPAMAPPPIPGMVTNGPVIITAFRPPAEYRRWYEAMEVCAKLSGHYEAVTWFVVPHAWHGLDGTTTYGMTLPHHRIVLNADNWRDSALVAHEEMHDILTRNHVDAPDGHPPAYFGDGKCAFRYYEPPTP